MSIDLTALRPVALQSPSGDRVLVSPFGAHVLSWTPNGFAEQLFVSARSRLDGSAPIRGGVPIVFPQFADYGGLPKHGFARTALWRVLDVVGARATFGIEDTAESRALWPCAFACRLDVSVLEGRLDIVLEVENRDPAPIAFQAALHTYLRVDDIEAVRIEGLQHTRFRDRVKDDAESAPPSDVLQVDREVDRIYLDAPRALAVREHGRELDIDIEDFRDVVVWNPWVAKAATLGDLAPDEYRRFLCIEPATIAVPIRLAPGAVWHGRQTLRVRR